MFIRYVCTILLTLMITGCSLSSGEGNSLPPPNLNSKPLNFTQASQYMARILTIPEQKVCLGNIEVEAPYQEPLVNAFLQELEVCLSQKMQVLERKRLREIVEQHRLETSNFFAKDNLQRLGQFTQVQYIALGELQERTVHYEILVKLVDVNTAIIHRAGKINLSKEYIPSSIIQEMSRLELAEKGYLAQLAQSQQILQYFTRSYTEHQSIQENQEQPLEVQFQARKKVLGNITPLKNGELLNQNDQYQLQIKLNKPAYLYSISVNSQGNIWPIFPHQNIMQDSSKQFYTLPGPDSQNWFTVQDRQGLGQIAMLISMRPIPELENLMEKVAKDKSESEISLKQPIFAIPEDITRKSKKQNSEQNSETLEIFKDSFVLPLWFQLR